MDEIVRISLLVVGGLALGIAVIWYLQFCYEEIRGTGQVVIDPLTVVNGEGKGDDELGKAMAQMLQARLGSLASDLRNAQAGLTATGSSTPTSAVERVGDVRLWTQDVAFSVGLLQPVEMKLSVGGVEVGGVIPWLQGGSAIDVPCTLRFTLMATKRKFLDRSRRWGSAVLMCGW
jgi:hypothetical protein